MASRPFSVVVAMLTPYTPRGTIDLDALRGHVDVLVEEGVDGLMPCGTTGEGPMLVEDEVEAVVATVVEAARGRVPVFAHVGRPSTEATLALARAAIATGATAISAVTPYFYEVGDDRLCSHYRELIQAVSGSEVLAYNIPSRTGNDLRADLVRSLADEGLAGIKDSTKSFDRHLEYLAIAGDRDGRAEGFSVFMGSDALALESLRHGSAGVVSAVANAAPRLLVGMKRAYLEGRHEEARKAQAEASGLREKLAAGGSALRGLKRATAGLLSERGLPYGESVRPPL